MPDFNHMVELNVGLCIYSAGIILVLLGGSLNRHDHRRAFIRAFILVLLTAFFCLMGEAGLRMLQGKPECIPLIKLSAFLSYGFNYISIGFLVLCQSCYIRETIPITTVYARVIMAICLLFSIITSTSVFTGFLYYVNSEGQIVHTQWYCIVELFDLISFLLEGALVVRHARTLGLTKSLSLMSVSLFQLFAVPLLLHWGTTPVFVANTFGLISLFMLFRADLSRQLAEKETELLQNRISITLSQIQPHFLHNVLSSIAALCDRNPTKAKELTITFSEYLRWNMQSLDNPKPVPFSDELQHVRKYLEIEKVRFGDDLNIIYRIEATDFLVPILSVQPIAENAVKHGVGKKEDGGTVIITSRERDHHYEITVSDDGVGFDPEQICNDGKTHVGIPNVQKRLHLMMNAAIEIQSAPDCGTTVTIKIPKEGH